MAVLDHVHDRPWSVMATNMVEHAAINAAMNDAMDEATGTSMDESMIKHVLDIGKDAGMVALNIRAVPKGRICSRI